LRLLPVRFGSVGGRRENVVGRRIGESGSHNNSGILRKYETTEPVCVPKREEKRWLGYGFMLRTAQDEAEI